MQWLLLSVLGHAFLYTSDLLLYAAGHYRKAALISASGSIITIAVALILVPRYGAAGMGVSMAVVQLPFVCTWFTFEACKYARISFGLLASEMLRGLGLPTAILASGIWCRWYSGENFIPLACACRRCNWVFLLRRLGIPHRATPLPSGVRNAQLIAEENGMFSCSLSASLAQ